MSNPPAGWYDDPGFPGRKRWFDGNQWTDHYQSAPVPPPAPQPQHTMGPMSSSRLNVKREVAYNRPQTPHSLTKWIILSLFVVGIPGLIYYSVSPNHYWTF
ncbi:DUF2510 domain-containing protein [Arthrobacter bambusae]